MLCALGGDPTHGGTDLAPAGAVCPGFEGGGLAEQLGGTTEFVGELEHGQGPCGLARDEAADLISPGGHGPVGDPFRVVVHPAILATGTADFNHVLTTMC